MKLLLPTYRINSVFDIKVEFLKEQNIETLIFDADSTLIQAKSRSVDKSVINKLGELEKSGINILIASNGRVDRINEIFSKHSIKAYPMCLKPLPFKLGRLIGKNGRKTAAIVGDQLFTDILCANFLGIRSFMTEPYGNDRGMFMKTKRRIEKRILNRKTKEVDI